MLIGEVIYHKDNKRTIEKVPLTGSNKAPSRWNGLGRAGFRRKTFRYDQVTHFMTYSMTYVT